jgi:hypothetical protein
MYIIYIVIVLEILLMVVCMSCIAKMDRNFLVYLI